MISTRGYRYGDTYRFNDRNGILMEDSHNTTPCTPELLSFPVHYVVMPFNNQALYDDLLPSMLFKNSSTSLECGQVFRKPFETSPGTHHLLSVFEYAMCICTLHDVYLSIISIV